MNLEYTYFITAPHYRESSLGIQVMHRLCHMINERGGRAWMVGCEVNPEWNTPVCTEHIFNDTVAGDKPWIAVYPDVVKGNPLNAPIVVRYMLNREGVIEGNSIDASDDDLFIWYRSEFADKEPDPNILCIECYDLDDFKEDQTAKDVALLYINRVPLSVVDRSVLPDDITILSMANPLSLKDLSRLLKRARVLYTYESSGTCVLANLCGCPVVALTAKGYEEYSVNPSTLKDIGNAGFTFTNTPEAIQDVKAELYKVRDHLLFKRHIIDEQLTRFLEITQNKAQLKHMASVPVSLNTWLASRILKIDAVPAIETLPRLLHVVFCRQASLDEIAITIDSISPGFDDSHNLLVIVGLPPEVAIDDGKKIFAETEESWLERVKYLAEEAAFDWLHCVDAGTSYVPQGILMMQHLLQQAGNCHAIYTDEVIKSVDGDVQSYFKPDFNLDLFLSSPQRYLRRFFFSRKSWLEAGGFTPGLSFAYEYELLVRYIFKWDMGCIGHVSEISTCVPAVDYDNSCADEERMVAEFYLQQRGFDDASVVKQAHGAWQLRYSGLRNEKVSILIDADNNPSSLLRCVKSLLDVTDWDELEILIALPHDITEEFNQIIISLANDTGKIRLFNGNPEHNFATRMNLLEQQSEGEYLVLVSSYNIFLMKDWLSALIYPAVRPEVGCVGPKIISPGKKILSAGIIAGADGWLGHVGQGDNWLSPGYLDRYQCEQNYSALSGNCLLVKRSVWHAVGGLDASWDNKFVEDVILSLTIRSAGLLCVWTPYSVIASDNPVLLRGNSLNGYNEQMTRLIKIMPHLFAEDPSYNRNLKLSFPLFQIDSQISTHWEPLMATRQPLILIEGASAQGAHARMMLTLLTCMEEAKYIRLSIVEGTPSLPEIIRQKPSIYIVGGGKSALSTTQLEFIKSDLNCRLLGLGDDINDEVTSRWYTENVERWLTFNSTQLAVLQKKNQQVQLLPGGLSARWFTNQPVDRDAKKEKARVLCIPGDWKQKELNFMQSIIAASSHEIDWVILGSWPKSWIAFVKETRRLKPSDLNPELLFELNVNAAVIFRSRNDSSRAEDVHLIYQLAACQIPVIFSDVAMLNTAIPLVKVKADHKKWLEALKGVAESRVATEGEETNLADLAKSSYRLTDDVLAEAYNVLLA